VHTQNFIDKLIHNLLKTTLNMCLQRNWLLLRSMGDGLTEEDLYGSAVREPLCRCCSQLAQALSALSGDSTLVKQPTQLTAAVEQLKVSVLQVYKQLG
jgi:hypothetical protein